MKKTLPKVPAYQRQQKLRDQLKLLDKQLTFVKEGHKLYPQLIQKRAEVQKQLLDVLKESTING